MFESNGKRVRVAVSVNPPDVELPEGVVHTPLPRETNEPVATRTQELPARPVAPHAEARAALAEKTGAGHAHGRDALAAKVAPSADGRVSINEATRDQLMAVPGIGPAKAEAILSYRQSTGPFASISEVDAVPGIGPATLEKLSKHLFVP